MRPEDRREAEQLAATLNQLERGEIYVVGCRTHVIGTHKMRSIIDVVQQREQFVTVHFERMRLVNDVQGTMLFITEAQEEIKLRGLSGIKGWQGISERAQKMIQGVS